MKTLGVYIHIPFCLRKCLYCDFLSGPAPLPVMERYVQALCREMETEAVQYKEYQVRTVFLGGGTPSVLSGEQIRRIFACLQDCFQTDPGAEITMEMNPGTVTKEKLEACRRAGVNRVSLGLQSGDNGELKTLGRVHTWEEFLQSYRLCRDAGFAQINVDLISALPGQTADSWKNTLEKTAALEPAHISAYSLIIEEGTPFYEIYGKGRGTEAPAALPDEEMQERIDQITKQFLASRGYRRYEISNYAKPGAECRHNCLYWMRGNYAGFGLGAASMVENRRWSNLTELDDYLSLQERKTPGSCRAGEPHSLSLQEQMEETMFLGLRMTEGVSCQKFRDCFGHSMEEVYGKVLEKHRAAGLLEYDGQTVRLTDRGIDVSNYVLADFLLS